MIGPVGQIALWLRGRFPEHAMTVKEDGGGMCFFIHGIGGISVDESLLRAWPASARIGRGSARPQGRERERGVRMKVRKGETITLEVEGE